MNEQNLKPVRTTEEAKAKGAIGGKKSGEAKRRKKSMKAAAKLLLSLPVQGDAEKQLVKLGLDPADADNQMLVMAAMFLKAAKGDVKAATFLRDTAGEVPMTERERAEANYTKERLKLDREKLNYTKERDKEAPPDEYESDGFIEALAGSAAEDWKDE